MRLISAVQVEVPVSRGIQVAAATVEKRNARVQVRVKTKNKGKCIEQNLGF